MYCQFTTGTTESIGIWKNLCVTFMYEIVLLFYKRQFVNGILNLRSFLAKYLLLYNDTLRLVTVAAQLLRQCGTFVHSLKIFV